MVTPSSASCAMPPSSQIEFNEEVRIESEEVKEAERIAKEAESKPLWQQLAAKREEEEAKYNAVRASLFGAPFVLRSCFQVNIDRSSRDFVSSAVVRANCGRLVDVSTVSLVTPASNLQWL